MLSIRINSIVFDFELPLTIFQACLVQKIYIPRFCYHFALRIVGNCRMCLVEEKSSLKPLASCAVTIINSHIIYTNTELVKKAREGVLEYLLINHPLDCPICDQGGECDLQDQTMVFGADRGRFYEYKRSTSNKNLGFLIKTYLNRCIHCARCTRFLDELAGTFELQLLGRGYKTEIGNYVFKFIKSEISGNIIDLCPVGALTSKPYAFKARPWELISVYTYDILEGFGSNIQLDFRGLELLRVLPRTNRFLNEEWISDKTRFSYDSYNTQRLTNIFFVNTVKNYQNLNWYEALIILKNVLFFNKNLNFYLSSGDFLDFETCFAIKNFSANSSSNFCNLALDNTNKDLRDYFSLKNLAILDSDLDDIEDFYFLIVNTNLRFESPIVNLRLRKIFSNHENIIYVIGYLSNFNFDFVHLEKNLSIKSLNFIIQNNDKKVTLSNDYIHLFKYCNFISHNITTMVLKDINVNISKDFNTFYYFSLALGQIELPKFFKKNFIKIHLLHHVEEDFINLNDSFFKILLPSSFYFEKPTTYVNNSHSFFNLLTHFCVKIPNTKPEWKIITALNEFLNSFQKKKLKTFLFFIPGIEFRVPELFEITTYFENFFSNIKKSSLFNNFYNSNIINRFSFVMNLCSTRFTILNDYIYNITS